MDTLDTQKGTQGAPGATGKEEDRREAGETEDPAALLAKAFSLAFPEEQVAREALAAASKEVSLDASLNFVLAMPAHASKEVDQVLTQLMLNEATVDADGVIDVTGADAPIVLTKQTVLPPSPMRRRSSTGNLALRLGSPAQEQAQEQAQADPEGVVADPKDLESLYMLSPSPGRARVNMAKWLNHLERLSPRSPRLPLSRKRRRKRTRLTRSATAPQFLENHGNALARARARATAPRNRPDAARQAEAPSRGKAGAASPARPRPPPLPITPRLGPRAVPISTAARIAAAFTSSFGLADSLSRRRARDSPPALDVTPATGPAAVPVSPAARAAQHADASLRTSSRRLELAPLALNGAGASGVRARRLPVAGRSIRRPGFSLAPLAVASAEAAPAIRADASPSPSPPPSPSPSASPSPAPAAHPLARRRPAFDRVQPLCVASSIGARAVLTGSSTQTLTPLLPSADTSQTSTGTSTTLRGSRRAVQLGPRTSTSSTATATPHHADADAQAFLLDPDDDDLAASVFVDSDEDDLFHCSSSYSYASYDNDGSAAGSASASAHTGEHRNAAPTAPAARSRPALYVDADGVLEDTANGLRMTPFGFSVLSESYGHEAALFSPGITPRFLKRFEAAWGGRPDNQDSPQPAPAPAPTKGPSRRGVAFDELQVLGKLGSGAMGVVRKVLHIPTGELMAEKTMPLAMNSSLRKRMARELRTLYQCDSPNIVRFKGAFFSEGNVRICMEWMDAGNLRELYFRKGAFPEPAMAAIALGVFRGLSYLKNTLNVMHRDVKPENILLSTSGQVKLCDFGVCANLVNSLAKSVIGTQMYFAPERLSHNSEGPQPYTVQADVWCMGLTLAELALGRFPYPPRKGQAAQDELTADQGPTHGAQPPNLGVMSLLQYFVHYPTPEIPLRYSAACRDFVAQCLLKNPDDRPGPDHLLQHPWLLEAAEADWDFGAWIRDGAPTPPASP